MQVKRSYAIIGLAVVALALAATSRGQTRSSLEPIAQTEEQTIYEKDLMPSIGAQLLQLRNQEYELKLKALVNVLKERLLENEAKRRGVSTEAFLEQTVDRNVPAPSAVEIEAYYLAKKDAYNQPLDEVRPQVEGALTRAKQQQARQNYIDQLQQRATVSILLKRPRVDINPDPFFTMFMPQANGVLDDYFECWFMTYDTKPTAMPEGLESIYNLGLSEEWLAPPSVKDYEKYRIK